MTTNYYDLVIVGGGPAGTGLLLKALKDGKESKLFQLRIALVEKSDRLIKGVLTDYKIDSDTLSDVFLECLEGETGNFLNFEGLGKEIDMIRKFKGLPIPLNDIETYYDKLGTLVMETMSQMKFCDFFMNTAASRVNMNGDGTFMVHLAGGKASLHAGQVVIACGGIPNEGYGQSLFFAGEVSLIRFASKTIHSDYLMKYGVPENLQAELLKNPKVVILGGSHGGFSAAHILMNAPDRIGFSAGDIRIWSTSLPKIFYPSSEEAIESGYTDFNDGDICPVTGRLYRLAGLRMNGRQLYIRMLRLNGAPVEERVCLKIFDGQKSEMENDLEEAALVILALGYRFNMLSVYDKNQDMLKFAGESTDHWVNDHCEILDEAGKAIPGLFAVGLSTGFIPRGKLGGEPSFSGQTNGIWYYQNILAEQIINRLQGADTADLS